MAHNRYYMLLIVIIIFIRIEDYVESVIEMQRKEQHTLGMRTGTGTITDKAILERQLTFFK